MDVSDERGERQRLVDHLQDRHGPGLGIGDGATLEWLYREHERLHASRDGAGTWPGGSEGPHSDGDLSSWDITKRLQMHLNRRHATNKGANLESVAELFDLHDQLHDEAYRRRRPDEYYPDRDHDRSNLT